MSQHLIVDLKSWFAYSFDVEKKHLRHIIIN